MYGIYNDVQRRLIPATSFVKGTAVRNALFSALVISLTSEIDDLHIDRIEVEAIWTMRSKVDKRAARKINYCN